GDRARRPGEQANPDVYVHIVERNAKGVVINGTKAIVTGAPYMHELLVMPSRNMQEADAHFAVCCAVPVDAEGVTIISRPAGRPGEPEHGAALFSRKYGQRSEEHTSELQSRENIVCRLLLEKKKTNKS